MLFDELPRLHDKLWYGKKDFLKKQMSFLKFGLRVTLFSSGDGWFSVIDKLPVESGFRQAVKDHIFARLREDARDTLLDSISDPAVAIKLDEINSKELNTPITTRLRERSDKLSFALRTENLPANSAEEQKQLQHTHDLELSIKSRTERLQTLGYTISMEPNFDIKLLRRIPKQQLRRFWRGNDREQAKICDHRYQMRLHSNIASLITSADTTMKNDTIALIDGRLVKEPDKILTLKDF
jgi:hypothetical protein